MIDEALRDVMVPWNERTAARSAVALPRGSRVPVPEGETLRLLLHWCRPRGGRQSDPDLSVAFFDEAWRYLGVCSYYELTARIGGAVVARSSGDYTDAPYPDGATELVDIERLSRKARPGRRRRAEGAAAERRRGADARRALPVRSRPAAGQRGVRPVP